MLRLPYIRTQAYAPLFSYKGAILHTRYFAITLLSPLMPLRRLTRLPLYAFSLFAIAAFRRACRFSLHYTPLLMMAFSHADTSAAIDNVA